LFGPETPVLYGPIGKAHHIFFKDLACSPCINVNNSKTARCRRGQPECLAGITVAEVLEAIGSSASAKPSRGVAPQHTGG